MAASDWRKELLCKHDSFRGSCCLGLPVSGNPAFQVTLKFRWKEFSEAVSVSPSSSGRFLYLFHCFITNGKRGIVMFSSFWFILCMGLSQKLEILHFLESCWWWFRVHFPEILNAMLVARRAGGFQFPFHQSTCIFTCFYCTVNMFIHVSRFRDQVRLAQCFPNFNKWSWISHKKYRQTKKHQANDLSSWSWFTNTHDELIPHMVKNCHKDPKTISLFAQYWI